MGEPAAVAPFPFLVGCGRSGTTLLRAMVDAHPDIAVPPESHFIVTLSRGSFDRQSFLDRLYASSRFELWELDRPVLETELDRVAPAAYPDAVRAVFAAWATRRGKHRWADKTPGYVLHIRRLAELFPEAVFVHLVRDGRDVAASFLELGWAGTIEEAALHWKLRVRRGRRAGARLPAGRYQELRYEELVADPGPSLRLVCAAAGLRFEPAMLDHHDRAAEVVRTTSHPTYHRHLSAPVTSDLRNWRRDIAADDVARFELVAGDLLAELGYERGSRRPSTRLRVDVA
ncbi:MAG: sulfotransferase family protein, partial [Acidimicrobiales bacterium]